METTISELNKRINNLELIVNQQDEDDNDNNNSESLTSQINSLKLKLSKIHQIHPEFEKLNQLNSKLKTWNNTTTTTTTKLKDNDISKEVKLETINLHSSHILETYPTIIELLNIQYASILKSLNNLVMTTDIQNNKQLLISKKPQLERINRIYQILNVKSMMITEKYIELTMKDNKFWIESEKQLEILNQKIKKIEQTRQEMNKY
ncbi:hypothetical protein K6H10_005580 [Candida tropicalis]